MTKPRKYRLEVYRSKSHAWDVFLDLADRMPHHEQVERRGKELHVVETDAEANLEALYEVIGSWKAWSYFVDGSPAPRRELAALYYKRKFNTGGALVQLLGQKPGRWPDEGDEGLRIEPIDPKPDDGP